MRRLITILLTIFSVAGVAQNRFTGKVMDNHDQPVANAHVKVEGTAKGTYTSESGEFELNDLPSEITLLITHVSFDDLKLNLSAPYSFMSIRLSDFFVLADQVVVRATRADRETPVTYTNLTEEEIEAQNFGQDVPFLLEQVPSITITSDAGAGVGYTGIRIRGSDATRINVTINGIPLNDSESHGVYWVNLPDLASSTQSIQVQRGVGTSTNGAGAFGATLNLQTTGFKQEAFGEYSLSVGSFNTFKNTVQFGTGLLKNNWSFEGRISKITSDGYVDRAYSDLKSAYLEGGYFGDKFSLRGVAMIGTEETYQAWWGTPEARLKDDVEGMNWVADVNWYSQEQRDNLLNSGRTFNYYLYDNEVDHYSQDHYQLHFNQELGENTSLNSAFHYTYGRGYYEQFKAGESFSDYDIDPIDTGGGQIDETDLVRRRWLDNHFYGVTYDLTHERNQLRMILGGAYNIYKGDHFGEVIWAQYANNLSKDHRYYDNTADKSDFNVYLKGNYSLNSQFNLFADLQVRAIDYQAEGPDNDRDGGIPIEIDVNENFQFFNPKFGVSYFPSHQDRLYFSFARSSREPVRSDFIDKSNIKDPKPEKLNNFELGWEKRWELHQLMVNGYFMQYKNQLVLTGAVNDVGAPIRENVENSYRAGVEIATSWTILPGLEWKPNVTISKNKIDMFTEVIYDYGVNWDEYNILTYEYNDVDLSFSPNVIAGSVIDWKPKDNWSIALVSKYVGRQYLDNTQQIQRSLESYFVHNFRMKYSINPKLFEQVNMGLLVNNLTNQLYSSNGYTYGYGGGGQMIRENYLYPQATTNFLISVDFVF